MSTAEFCAGIRSGLSYCGGHTIPAARENAEFVRVTDSAKEREGYHADHDWERVSVDSEAPGEGRTLTRSSGGGD